MASGISDKCLTIEIPLFIGVTRNIGTIKIVENGACVNTILVGKMTVTSDE